MRTRAVLAVLAFGCCTLAACGSDGDDSSPGEDASPQEAGADVPEEGDAGTTYVGTLDDGSTLRVRLDVDATDPAVAPFESFRAATGAPEVTWLVGQITVPDGADGAGRFVTFVAEGADPMDDDPMDATDGIVSADFACALLDDWVEVSANPAATAEAQLALIDGECGGQTLSVVAPGGQTTSYVMAIEGAVPEFERLTAGLSTELAPA